MAVVAQHARELYLVAPKQDRATSTEFLKSCLDREAIESDLSTLFPKPGRCAVGKPGDTILLTGSIYLIGEAMARIQGARSGEGSRLQDKI
jgi:dihydrofolate synthase/folylpolyglutamate synthase